MEESRSLTLLFCPWPCSSLFDVFDLEWPSALIENKLKTTQERLKAYEEERNEQLKNLAHGYWACEFRYDEILKDTYKFRQSANPNKLARWPNCHDLGYMNFILTEHYPTIDKGLKEWEECIKKEYNEEVVSKDKAILMTLDNFIYWNNLCEKTIKDIAELEVRLAKRKIYEAKMRR